MENITIEYVRVTAGPGSHNFDCIAESIELAVKDRVNVILVHNDYEYAIKYRKIIGEVRNGRVKPASSI